MNTLNYSNDCNHAKFLNWIPPLIEVLKKSGGSATPKEIREAIAFKMNLDDALLTERYEKSGQLRFDNQVYWAKQYLAWEGLVETSRRGVWSLTDNGWKVSLSYQDALSIFNKWVKFHQDKRKNRCINQIVETLDENGTNENEFAENLSLIEILQKTSPKGFEHLCGRLLREYDFEDIVITKASNDGGFDGTAILKINPFVSLSVYFECKKYTGVVPIAKVREFIGVLSTEKRGVEKGIFITTGMFTNAALEIGKNNTMLELIDGDKLVEMFENVELGVRKRYIYEPDPAFFLQYTE